MGGTKIEACLFDSNFSPLASRRILTPKRSFNDLVEAVVDQYEWMCASAEVSDLPLGIGVPGLTEAATGFSLASNLPAMRMPLIGEVSQRLGCVVATENDCKCFALSEANGGAGESFTNVFGLILGTGCGGGVCHKGRLVKGSNGLPGEIGHIGIPLDAVPGVSMPILACACGRKGCYETLISGPGLTALARHLTGLEPQPEQIAEGAAEGDGAMNRILSIWSDIVCELLRTIQGMVDPDCIVLGGGLSRMSGVTARLQQRLPLHEIRGVRRPEIVLAQFGDSSGTRGAAMVGACHDLQD